MSRIFAGAERHLDDIDPKRDQHGAVKATREVLLKKRGAVKFHVDDGVPLLADAVTGATVYVD